MDLSDEQLDRYARHIILKEIGGAGQARLLESRVAVIGAGGIGSPVIQYLAATGVGRLTIIDDDDVSLSNLQRQVLFGTGEVGHVKVDAAASAVRSEEHTSELQSLMRISYAVFCLKKKKTSHVNRTYTVFHVIP